MASEAVGVVIKAKGEMIYIWRIAADCPENLIVTFERGAVDSTSLRSVTPIAEEEVALFSHRGGLKDLGGRPYIPNSAQLPLVSVAAGRELGLLPGDAVQTLAAQVFCADGILDALLLNPLRSVAAVDWAHSQALFIPGTKQVMKFTKLRLLPDSMNGLKLARLDEFGPFLLADERIKAVFSDCQLCEFSLVSEIRP